MPRILWVIRLQYRLEKAQIFISQIRMSTAQAGRTTRISNLSLEKFIFNREAYRLDSEGWVRLERLLIDSHLDSKNTKNIQKVKIKGSKGFEDTYKVKVSTSDKELFYSMTQELQLQWFSHVINTRIQEDGKGTPVLAQYVNVCSGKILKKTFLGEWEQCFVMITQEGLTVCKEEDNSKVELEIEGVKQIWTRFEIFEVEGRPYFVFKLRSFFKYQFGAPVDNITKWTKAFYSLISFA